MNEPVEAETGFRTCGIMYALRDRRGRGAARRLARARAALPARHADAEPSRGRASCCPAPPRLPRRALYTTSDGRAEPQKAAPAIAAAARRAGATILTGCAVRGIETRRGRVAAAVTEKGRIACDSVVLAGGAWSRLFCGNLGLRLPQLKVRASVMRTEPLDGGARDRGADGRLRLPQADGRRLHGRELGVRTLRPRARQLPALPRLPAGPARWSASSLHFRLGGALRRGMAHAASAGSSTSPRRSSRSASSTRSPTRSFYDQARPASPRCSRPSRRREWRRAGAA